jgi:hypothetical protein
MDSIELKGLTFRVAIEPDDGALGAPWDEHDGHGPVRHTRAAFKQPGERILHSDRDGQWLYDWAGAMRKAEKDGWGLSPDDTAALAQKLGRAPTPGEIRAEAVQRDFDFCRRYASGDWDWCGVVVTLLDADGEPTHERESLWGIESDEYSYHEEVARELAEEIASRIGRRKYAERGAVRVRVRK